MKIPLWLAVSFLAAHVFGDEVHLANGGILKNVTIDWMYSDGALIKDVSGRSVKYWWRLLAPEEEARIRAIFQKREAGEAAQKLLIEIAVTVSVEPYLFRAKTTSFTGQKYKKTSSENWEPVGEKFNAVLNESLPKDFGSDDKFLMTLYPIGHTADEFRLPVYTRDAAVAADFIRAHPPVVMSEPSADGR